MHSNTKRELMRLISLVAVRAFPIKDSKKGINEVESSCCYDENEVAHTMVYRIQKKSIVIHGVTNKSSSNKSQ